MSRKTKNAQALVVADRDERILKLRLAGMSHLDIAREVGVHVNTVAKSLKRSHLKLTERCAESAAELVFRQSQQLEKMFQRLYEETVETRDGEPVPVDHGTARRIEVMLKVQERYSKLLGLDAPEKTQTLSVGFNFQDMTPDEIRSRLEQLGQEHRAAYQPPPQVEFHELPGEHLEEIEGEFIEKEGDGNSPPHSSTELISDIGPSLPSASPHDHESGGNSDPLHEGVAGSVPLHPPVSPSPPTILVPDPTASRAGEDGPWLPW